MALELEDRENAESIKMLAILFDLSPKLAKTNTITNNFQKLNSQVTSFESSYKKLEAPELVSKATLAPEEALSELQIKQVLEFKNLRELTVSIDTFLKLKSHLKQFKLLKKLYISGDLKRELILSKDDIKLFKNISHLSLEFIPQLTLLSTKELPTLKSVSFFGSNLKNSDWSLLKNFQQVEELNLGFTRFKATDFMHLRNLNKLKSLNLSRNRITTEEFAKLPQLPGLEKLNTEIGIETRIVEKSSELPLLNFSKFPKLHSLNLTGRKISKLQLKGITHCQDMTSLSYSGLQLSSELLTDLTTLKKLKEISEVYVKDFPLTPKNRDFLSQLEIVNKATFIDTNFNDHDWTNYTFLKNAKNIKIERCPISIVPSLSSYKNLYSLDLRECPLKGNISISNPTLRLLYFDKNTASKLILNTLNLSQLPTDSANTPIGIKGSLPKVKYHEIRNRSFEESDQVLINQLTNLEHLSFYHCDFNKIPDFKSLPKLKSISFNNQGQALPPDIFKAIIEIANLESLDLSSCKIDDRYIKTISGYKNLKALDLGWNSLRGKTLHYLTNLKNLESLDLGVNKSLKWQETIDLLIKHTKLKEINLEAVPITKTGFQKLLKNKQLKSINISNEFKKFIPKEDRKRFTFSIFHTK